MYMSSSGYLDLVTNNKVYLQDAGFFVCAHCTEVSFSEDIKGQVNETLTCPNCRTESLIHSQYIKTWTMCKSITKHNLKLQPGQGQILL